MIAMQRLTRWTFATAFSACLGLGGVAGAATEFDGEWALTVPGGGAGWLGVRDVDGIPKVDLMWIAGSVTPLEDITLDGNMLTLKRDKQIITAQRDGDRLHLQTVTPGASGQAGQKVSFEGKLQPPLPPAPDLSKVKFGEPIKLFNGKDMTGWRLLDPKAANGWSVKDGVLSNNPAQPEGGAHKNYGNIRTDKEFEDFNLKLEAMVPPDGNSGVYLRGIYEVQVADTFGQKPDSHNMGAVYSRITPTQAAEKKAGEWQTLDITLVDRHATVVLNGKKIVDNKPVLGCTGGALWSDVTKAGPIYLQGDHSRVNYRNIELRPVVK